MFNGTVGSVGWTLSIGNARSAAPTLDPTILSGTNFAGVTATYNLVFDQAVDFKFFNDALTKFGGLAGAGGKTENFKIVGGVANFSLLGNGANITPPPVRRPSTRCWERRA